MVQDKRTAIAKELTKAFGHSPQYASSLVERLVKRIDFNMRPRGSNPLTIDTDIQIVGFKVQHHSAREAARQVHLTAGHN